MMNRAKRLACTLASAIVLATSSAADTKPDPVRAAPMSTTPLSFSSRSAHSSAAAWYPAWVMIGLGFPLDNEQITVPGVGRREALFVGNGFSTARVELGWALSNSSSAAASSSALGALAPYLVLGLLARQDNINAFTFPGWSVPTNGSSDFWGAYGGLNLRFLDTSTAASSSLASLYWAGFFNLGYGEADVTAFNGAYRRSGKGEFYEVGTEMMFDLGAIFVGPALLYREFNHNGIKAEEGVFEIRVNVPIRRR